MTLQTEKSNQQNHFPWLDWLRFTGALIVVIVHARSFTATSFGALEPEYKNYFSGCFYFLTRIGTQGVLIFFVLSGFLVGGKALERLSQGSFKFWDYCLDRSTRILVPFIPGLLFTACVAHLLDKESDGATSFVGNLFFLQGIWVEPYATNPPLWSLSYEVWFYILIGAFAGLFLKGIGKWYALVLLFAGLLVFTRLHSTYLFCWILGAAAFVNRPKHRSNRLLVIAIILTVYGMMAVQFFSEAQTASISLKMQQYSAVFISLEAGYLMFSFGISLLIQQLILMPPQSNSLVKFERIGTRLANFSYTLYLIHNPVIYLFTYAGLERSSRLNLNFFGTFITIILTCLVAAWLFYLPFEKRTSELRRYIRTRIISRATSSICA